MLRSLGTRTLPFPLLGALILCGAPRRKRMRTTFLPLSPLVGNSGPSTTPAFFLSFIHTMLGSQAEAGSCCLWVKRGKCNVVSLNLLHASKVVLGCMLALEVVVHQKLHQDVLQVKARRLLSNSAPGPCAPLPNWTFLEVRILKISPQLQLRHAYLVSYL